MSCSPSWNLCRFLFSCDHMSKSLIFDLTNWSIIQYLACLNGWGNSRHGNTTTTTIEAAGQVKCVRKHTEARLLTWLDYTVAHIYSVVKSRHLCVYLIYQILPNSVFFGKD